MPNPSQDTERVAWLVECPKYHPGEYFALCDCGCGRHWWTKDVHRATKFETKEAAESARGKDENCVAVEHLFGLQWPPALNQSQAPDVSRLTVPIDGLEDALFDALYDTAGLMGVATRKCAKSCVDALHSLANVDTQQRVEGEPTEAWQPIETAPPDGVRRIVYFPPIPATTRRSGMEEHIGICDHSGGPFRHATYWQPLPAPPAMRGAAPPAGGEK